MPTLRTSAILVAAAAAGLLLSSARADAQAYYQGVADLSSYNGNVTIVRGDSGQQFAATTNATLVPGDYLTTGSGSRATVALDGVSMLRLWSNAQVRFSNLSPGSSEMQLGYGTVNLAELQGGGGEQIDTPSLSVRPNQSGDYRVSVNGNGQTVVTVRSGSATITTGAGSRTLGPGSTLVASGSYSNPSIAFQGAPGFDAFDQYNIAADQSLQSAYNGNPYLSPDLAGYANLANYGSWQNVPGYGWAWAPSNQTANNFAPYQNGQWVWEPGYGYTWVDNAPYGYTVSHYGSWFNNPSYGGWLWQPPAYQNQSTPSSLANLWLPAAVSFFLNGGQGFDLNTLLNGFLGMNGAYAPDAQIGWIPLAPGQQYVPWYGQDYAYPQTALTPVTNITNIYEYYPNARYYGGIETMRVSQWRTGNFRTITVVRPQQLQRVYVVRGAVPLVPTTQTLRYTTRTVSRVTIARAFTQSRLASRAPDTSRIAFTAQQSRIRTLVAAKPHTVTLTSVHRVTTHTVYHPVAHAPVHIAVMKPVAPVRHPVTTPVHHEAAPVHHEVTAPVHHEAAPVHHQVTAPVHHEAAPVHHEVTAPVHHEAAPAAPVHHEAAPAAPVHHEAAPAAPVHHEAAPAAPVHHEAAPAAPVHHEAAPAAPVHHEAAPVARHEETKTPEKPKPSPKPIS